jgi:two-component system, sensor histidine kinase PdtaS
VIAPGDISLRVISERDGLALRVGVMGGMATAIIPAAELRDAAKDGARNISRIAIRDGDDELFLYENPNKASADDKEAVTQWPIGTRDIRVAVASRIPSVTALDQLVLLLPVVMWVIAALMSWLLVSRLLIRPLKLLQRAVSRFQPGDSALGLPRKLGPATEIQELRDAFARAVTRVEDSEREMAGALEGQRRLVREVHHRVKNNLQVVASLLNIHGRSAETVPARAAYAAIARRVGALSVVHRNHFAEMEESRGIALRPLLSELAAELRAGAPETARAMQVELDVETADTTQDVAVAIAFLITEIVEYAMLRRPQDAIEISLRRTSDLTGRLTICSPILAPDEDGEPDKAQFERIVGGLAKQLRSNLERKLGRYSVDLPMFPAR